MNLDTPDSTSQFLKHFSDPEATKVYAVGVRRFVPALDALHRMTAVLLAESAPPDAHVLVLGAGGGLELRALAEAHPGWTFIGIDPAPEMLRQAERMLGDFASRVSLVEGYIDDAPDDLFDAAVCLLTLHFLPLPARQETVRAIHRRLHPGAPFVAAHGSFPQEDGARSRWLDRYADYAIASGADPEQARGARDAIEASGIMLTPEADEAVLKAGGFADIHLFYMAFTWRGWIGHA